MYFWWLWNNRTESPIGRGHRSRTLKGTLKSARMEMGRTKTYIVLISSIADSDRAYRPKYLKGYLVRIVLPDSAVHSVYVLERNNRAYLVKKDGSLARWSEVKSDYGF